MKPVPPMIALAVLLVATGCRQQPTPEANPPTSAQPTLAPSPTESPTTASPREVAKRNHVPVPKGGSVKSARETKTRVHVVLTYRGQPNPDPYLEQVRKAGWRVVESKPIGSEGFLLRRRSAGIVFACAVLEYLRTGVVVWTLLAAFVRCHQTYGGL